MSDAPKQSSDSWLLFWILVVLCMVSFQVSDIATAVREINQTNKAAAPQSKEASK